MVNLHFDWIWAKCASRCSRFAAGGCAYSSGRQHYAHRNHRVHTHSLISKCADAPIQDHDHPSATCHSQPHTQLRTADRRARAEALTQCCRCRPGRIASSPGLMPPRHWTACLLGAASPTARAAGTLLLQAPEGCGYTRRWTTCDNGHLRTPQRQA